MTKSRGGTRTVSKHLLILLLFAMPLIAAEPPKARHLEAINRQIWRPFIEGIRTDRAELYVGVHSDEFFWVAPGDKGRIMNHKEYEEDSRLVMKRRKEAGERTEIEFRFLERNITDALAVEKCVIKFVLHRPGKAAQTSYGIAHYFSRNEKGVWKMWLQYGSREPATEELFASAAPVDDIARFVSTAK